MPKILAAEVKDSVRRALTQMRWSLLPEAIQSSYLARWILDFDALVHPNAREIEGTFYEQDQPKYLSFALQRFVRPALKDRTTFYFASLFHIGRQWRVSELATAAVAEASVQEPASKKPSVLRVFNKTAADLIKESLDRASKETALDRRYLETLLRADASDLQGALRTVLSQAVEHHKRVLRQAQTWWQAWEREVDELRNSVDKARQETYKFNHLFRRQHLYDRELESAMMGFVDLLEHLSSTPQLFTELSAAGFTYIRKSEGNDPAWTDQSPMFFALSILASRREGIDVLERFFKHLENTEQYRLQLERDKVEQRREELLQPQKCLVLSSLEAKYGGQDPFADFLPLRNAPSIKLYDLIREHTLPDKSHSPWLQTWTSLLTPRMTTYSQIDLSGDLDAKEVVETYCRSADVTIKDSLRHEPLVPGEAWSKYVQRLFERNWIQPLAQSLAREQQKSDNDRTQHTFSILLSIIAKVVTQLHSKQYDLISPERTRLEKLWSDLLASNWSKDW